MNKNKTLHDTMKICNLFDMTSVQCRTFNHSVYMVIFSCLIFTLLHMLAVLPWQSCVIRKIREKIFCPRTRGWRQKGKKSKWGEFFLISKLLYFTDLSSKTSQHLLKTPFNKVNESDASSQIFYHFHRIIYIHLKSSDTKWK
jgi:hypothetical protein